MFGFTLRRIGSGIVLVVVIPTITFFLMHMSATNIARAVLGNAASPEQVAKKAAALGLDQPIWQQYGSYVQNALQGDLGRSYFSNVEVADALTNRLPVTISLVLGATIIAAIVATVLGVMAAVYRGWIDRVVQIVVVVGFAIPGFWLAMELVSFFAINWRLFPATGYVRFADSPTQWAYSLVLPVGSLCIAAVATTAQQIRGSVIDMLRQDWVRTLRSRGLPEMRVLFRHVLRNAGVSGFTVLALQFIGLLGGAIFVEQVFSLPGIGHILSVSTSSGDIPLVMGVVIVLTIIVVIVNLIIDLSVVFLNPKARLS